MKSITLLVSLLAVVGLLGCATPYRAPAPAAHIKLERVDSPVIVVEKIWLEEKQGPLTLAGSVFRRHRADDTTRSHLDVTIFDSSGRVLRTTVEHFEPRQIRARRVRRHTDAHYRIELPVATADIARIEVRAHEGDHS